MYVGVTGSMMISQMFLVCADECACPHQRSEVSFIGSDITLKNIGTGKHGVH